MNLRVTEPEAAPRAAAMKFTYASGSRPLAGYTLKRGIGRGGFGEVYFASSDAGKEVALKLIRRNLDVELRGVTQCLNLKHLNLLSLFDVKQDELGDSWVVMEYIPGDSLEAVVERHPDGLPVQEALAWFHGIAAGVCYLHDHGIVHRDLKPGNIFRDEGIVKIGDYGLSKFISASRRSGQTESVGTVHYMAPEIGNGRYGKEIDIYALGIILYEMLTGHVPFEGESVGEVLMKHLTAEPNLEGVSEPYRSAIAKTLTKDPEARIKTVGELLALLPAPSDEVAGGVSSTRAEHPLPLERPFTGASRSAADGVLHASAADRAARRDRIVSAVLVAGEEPIARAVRSGSRRFIASWRSGRLNPAAKLSIVWLAVILVLVLFAFPPMLIAVPEILTFYAAYYAIRAIAIAFRDEVPAKRAPNAQERMTPLQVAVPRPRASAPPRQPVPSAIPCPSCSGTGFRYREIQRRGDRFTVKESCRRCAGGGTATPSSPATKPTRRRIEELTGSLLASTAVAAVMSIFLSVVHANKFEPGRFAWLLLVTTLGSWFVLAPGKFWEGRDGDPTLRRLTLMVFGLALGAVAWGLKDFLFVSLHADWRLPPPLTEGYVSSRFYEADGSPSLVAHMSYFASLMLLIGWWKQADPARTARLRVGPVLVAAFWGWLLDFFWPFPQPWGIMVAASMSIAVQLAATWERPKRRTV